MKLWKRNAVVAAIVLFVCVAVYLNWSYQQDEVDAGKTLGQTALVGGRTNDPLLPAASAASFTEAMSNIRWYWAVRLTFSVSSSVSRLRSSTVSADSMVSCT